MHQNTSETYQQAPQRWQRAIGLSTISIAVGLLGPGSLANEEPPSGGHFHVQMPGVLTQDEAQEIYAGIANDMTNAYGLSQDRSSKRYQRWPRYNATPYQSATHGNRYVNNYANPIAGDYDRLAEVNSLPVGSVLAKDSFAVTDTGDVFLGPLFLMEKMEPGFSPEGHDWRYSMIMPDGSYFGVTGGDAAEKVEFCRTCHETAGDEVDHLFFVPEEFRLAN